MSALPPIIYWLQNRCAELTAWPAGRAIRPAIVTRCTSMSDFFRPVRHHSTAVCPVLSIAMSIVARSPCYARSSEEMIAPKRQPVGSMSPKRAGRACARAPLTPSTPERERSPGHQHKGSRNSSSPVRASPASQHQEPFRSEAPDCRERHRMFAFLFSLKNTSASGFEFPSSSTGRTKPKSYLASMGRSRINLVTPSMSAVLMPLKNIFQHTPFIACRIAIPTRSRRN